MSIVQKTFETLTKAYKIKIDEKTKIQSKEIENEDKIYLY